MKKGYLQVYTGNGKGKTTAAVGLAVRGAGAGLQVVVSQFMKAMDTSEVKILNKIENVDILRYAQSKKFVWDMTDKEKEHLGELMHRQLSDTLKEAKKDKADIVIFDELLGAFHAGFIGREQIENMLDNRPDTVEYIITGRNAPEWLLDRADLVTEMTEYKHYMAEGVNGRKGIEF
ncbi:MAG: cob(I)yrinic acid a,c-diamide adenosyltransferase [Eubacteriales bacterium]